MDNSVIVLLVILGIMALIALGAFIIYKVMHPKLKEEKPSQEQIIKEEMDRYLKPIDDDEVAKQVEDYKDNEE